ncbi:MAG: molybdenum cofactor biosynthesis protein MoaE [Alphaproteobacteria bacterium]
MRIIVSDNKIDIGAEINTLKQNADGVGAIATFIGTVRDKTGDLHSLTLEHYPNMTEGKLTAIAETAMEKFNLMNITIYHRYGEMLVGEDIVFVGATSPHRQDCQSAVSFVMDYLKTDAPFWKMETFKDGSTKWVDQKQEDLDKKDSWK